MAGMATRVQGVKTESASLPEAKAAPADDASPLDAAQLAEAFALFSRASEELSTAYNALQAQVGQLTERLSVLMGALPAGVLERIDSLEQLRALEAGWRIAVTLAPSPFPPGVDTPDDLARAERLWQDMERAGRNG